VEVGGTLAERAVTHGTFVIERNYPVAPERVFKAFSDPATKHRWFVDDEASGAENFGMDFRVGGVERKRFSNKHGVFTNDTVYLDIIPNQRIVFAYTMSMNDRRFSSSQATVELVAAEKGTNLIFTEQGAYFEGSDGPKMRQDGWRVLLESLAKELAG